MRALTRDEFLSRANITHKSQYDYTHVVYVNAKTPIDIICYVHGIFTQLPSNHLGGAQCPKCAQLNRAATNKKRYGGVCSQSSDHVRSKSKQTMLAKYGAEYTTQSDILIKKIKDTNMERYGCEYSSQNDVIKEKKQQTNQVKYGRLCHTQQHITCYMLSDIDNYEWLYDQYITQQKTSDMIAQELGICATTVLNRLKQHEISIKQCVGFSYKAVAWIKSLNNSNIQHALNGGEYTIPGTRYRVDGYDPFTNTVYEFHGDVWHGNPDVFLPNDVCNPFSNESADTLYQRTMMRDRLITNKGYNLVTMWEHTYDTNNKPIF